MIESLIKLNAVEVRTWIFLIFALLIIMNIISTGVIVVMHYWPRKSGIVIKTEKEKLF